jgi:hypothetical protein
MVNVIMVPHQLTMHRTFFLHTNSITGEWPMDFNEVTKTTLKQPKATKCSDHHTSAKIVERILKRTERKVGDVLGRDHFGL